MPDVKLTISGKNLSREAIQQLRKDLDQTATVLAKVDKGTVDIKDNTKDLKEGLTGLAVAFGAISAAIGYTIKTSIDASVSMERLMKGLTAISGSAEGARKQLVQLREVARLPGLGLQEAAQGSISLQAVGFSADEAAKALMSFGNALATVGKGREELAGVTLALTQMRAKGKVLAEELNQIAERVPQIRTAMMNAFGTGSTEDIQAMGISAAAFIAKITDELAKLPPVSGGAANAIENFNDSLFQARASIGDVFLPLIGKLLNTAAGLVEAFNSLDKATIKTIGWTLALTGGMAALTAASLGLAIAWDKLAAAQVVLTVGIAKLKSALQTLYLFFAINPIYLYTAAIVAAAGALAYLTYRLTDTSKKFEKFASTVESATKELQKAKRLEELSRKLEELKSKTELTKEETEELARVQAEIVKLAPELVDAFDREGRALTENTKKIQERINKLKEMSEAEVQATRVLSAEDIAKKKAEIDRLTKAIENAQTELIGYNKAQLEGTKIKVQVPPSELGDVAYTIEAPAEVFQRDTNKLIANLKKRKDKVQAELDELQKPLEAYDKLKEIPVIPPPEPYKYTKEEKAQFDDLTKAKVEAIEYEYEKTIATARTEFKIFKELNDEKIEGIKKNSINEQEAIAKVAAVESQMQAQRLRMTTAIREADNQRAEEYRNIFTEAAKAEADAIQDKHSRALEAAKIELDTAEEKYNRERDLINRSGLDAKRKASELQAIETELNTARIQNSNRLRDIQEEIDKETYDRQRQVIEDIGSLSIIQNDIIYSKILRRYKAEEYYAQKIRAEAEKELSGVAISHEQDISLLKAEYDYFETTADRKGRIEAELAAKQERFTEQVRTKREEAEKLIADRIVEEHQKVLDVQIQNLRLLADVKDNDHLRTLANLDVEYIANKQSIDRQIKDESTLEDTRVELRKQLIGIDEKYESDRAKLIEERINAERDFILETDKLKADAIKDDYDRNRAIAIAQYAIDEERLNRLKESGGLTIYEQSQVDDRLVALHKTLANELLSIDRNYTDRKISEEKRAYDVYVENERIRLSMLDNRVKAALGMLKLEYDARVEAINRELEEYEISIARKTELETQLGLLKEQYNKDYQTTALDDYSVMLSDFSNLIVDLPFDLVNAFQSASQLEKQYADEVREVQATLSDDINRIRDDSTRNAAQKAREIERLEKESANKRAEIERKLIEEREAIYEDYVKNFLFGLLGAVEAEIQKRLAAKIFGQLASLALNFIAPGAGTAVGAATSIMGAESGVDLPGLIGFDSPANDAYARTVGRQTAMLMGSSFDDVHNDFKARIKGTDAAAYALGNRSAGDMLDNFQQGFVQGSSVINNSSGGNNRELITTLSAIQTRLDNPPEFKLILDGRELHSKIFARDDKVRHRGDGY